MTLQFPHPGASMAKRKRKIPDPAEQARIEAERRRNPALWGVNREAMALPANADARFERASRGERGKRDHETRAARYNAIGLLRAWGAIDPHHVEAARRLTVMLAYRAAVAGGSGAQERVNHSAGARDGVTDLRLDYGDEAEFVLARTGRASALLLLALLEPEVRSGQPLRAWREVVEAITGETEPKAQGARVREALENLHAAIVELDRTPRDRIVRRARHKEHGAVDRVLGSVH